VAVNNFFVPLRDLHMKSEETSSEENSNNKRGTNESTGKGRPFLVILTTEANLINLQRELKTIMNGELWNIAIGSWITTKSTMDYNAVQKFLTKKNLHFSTFYTKLDKVISCYRAFVWQSFCREHHCGPPGDKTTVSSV
jgi:hypothetical protein